MLNGEDFYINGDGESSRDFTYIDNIVQMNILPGTTTNEKQIVYDIKSISKNSYKRL